ncbi:MAG: bestrophin family protein [Leadbetterella sp.]
MYLNRVIPFKLIARYAWSNWIFSFLYGLLVIGLYDWLECKIVSIPFFPISLIGTAVSFYVGFKNNSSYERLWEARRIWGNITNVSRTLAIYIKDFVNVDHKIHYELVMRNVAYINAIRIQLRSKRVWDKSDKSSIAIVRSITHFSQGGLFEELNDFVDKQELEGYKGKANIATQILATQSSRMSELFRLGQISELKQIEISKQLAELYNQQGGCERIKTFPFPRQYAFFSKVFVWIFIAFLPFGLLNEFAKISPSHIWLTLPVYMLISWIFNAMEIIGDTSENPFENGVNDIPMTAICRNIQIDMLEVIGHDVIPDRVVPENHILM